MGEIIQCPKCTSRHPATTSWDPATAGSIKARPCGHVVTYDEACKFWPERMKAVEDEMIEALDG